MSRYEGEMIMKVNPYVDEEYRTEIKRLKDENEKLNVLFADISEAFISRSYNDDFEMAQAGKEIYELFYGGKDPKEVFHNAEVPKSSRQLLSEAKEIIRKLLKDIEIVENEYKFTSQFAIKAEQFLKECK